MFQDHSRDSGGYYRLVPPGVFGRRSVQFVRTLPGISSPPERHLRKDGVYPLKEGRDQSLLLVGVPVPGGDGVCPPLSLWSGSLLLGEWVCLRIKGVLPGLEYCVRIKAKETSPVYIGGLGVQLYGVFPGYKGVEDLKLPPVRLPVRDLSGGLANYLKSVPGGGGKYQSDSYLPVLGDPTFQVLQGASLGGDMIYIQTYKTGGLPESVSLSQSEDSPKGHKGEEGYLSGLSVSVLLGSHRPDSPGYLLERSDPCSLSC